MAVMEVPRGAGIVIWMMQWLISPLTSLERLLGNSAKHCSLAGLGKVVSALRRQWRCFLVLLLLLCGVLITLLVVPFRSGEARKMLRKRWSAALLDVLAIRVEADIGQVPPGSLLVANHISWLDVFVISAMLPAAFVSKAEVRAWPLIGWLAARHDTIFLRRGSRGHAQAINQEVATVLAQGDYVALFPEGTTSDGSRVLHFHAALLQPALAVGRPVVPLALSYYEADGRRSLAPRYDGAITFMQSLRAMVSRPWLRVRLTAAPPLGLNGEDRRVVAALAREIIAARMS